MRRPLRVTRTVMSDKGGLSEIEITPDSKALNVARLHLDGNRWVELRLNREGALELRCDGGGLVLLPHADNTVRVEVRPFPGSEG